MVTIKDRHYIRNCIIHGILVNFEEPKETLFFEALSYMMLLEEFFYDCTYHMDSEGNPEDFLRDSKVTFQIENEKIDDCNRRVRFSFSDRKHTYKETINIER